MLVDCFVICVGASVFELVSNKCITSFEMAIKDLALRGSFYLANERLSLSFLHLVNDSNSGDWLPC